MSGISTHVLDLTNGQPAAGMKVRLDRLGGTGWEPLVEKLTDADGRISDLLLAPGLVKGIHRLTFSTRDYAHGRGVPTFYPEVQVMFDVGDAAKHYHVPLLFSPYGYSTYRGS